MLAEVSVGFGGLQLAARALARRCASVSVALALVCAPFTGVARGSATSVTRPMQRDPSQAERKADEALRDEIDRALEGRDWDLFLEKAGEALEQLPELASSEGRRREVVGLVGGYEIDQRSETQLERSVEILNAYKAQLRGAYGDGAKSRPGWEEAERYIEDLRRRLPETTATPSMEVPRAATLASSPPPPPDTTNAQRRERGVGPLAISGAVLTGVGGILLIAGLAFAPRAKKHLDENNDAVGACAGEPTCPEASAALDAWRRSSGTTLGLAIPGVALLGVGIGLLVAGLRGKRLGTGRAAAAPGGIHFRF